MPRIAAEPDPLLDSISWDSIRLPVELAPVSDLPLEAGAELYYFGNSDIDQTEWAYADFKQA